MNNKIWNSATDAITIADRLISERHLNNDVSSHCATKNSGLFVA